MSTVDISALAEGIKWAKEATALETEAEVAVIEARSNGDDHAEELANAKLIVASYATRGAFEQIGRDLVALTDAADPVPAPDPAPATPPADPPAETTTTGAESVKVETTEGAAPGGTTEGSVAGAEPPAEAPLPATE